MKTRIKILTTAGGDKIYYPQSKSFFFFWCNFTFCMHDVCFKSEELACNYLNNLHQKIRSDKQMKDNSKIVSTTYIPYETNQS